MEPTIPPSCVVLTSAGALNEGRPDTQRIQNAIDHCQPGHSVELKTDAFLAGPIQLREGVTLLVGKGATLFASRNPRDFDLKPGSCGVVNKEGHGCRPLIGADHISGAGVAGEGTIDGRGGETLTGQKVSWWDLAQEAKVRDLNQSCPRLLHLTGANDFTLYRITLKNGPNFHVLYSGGNGFTAWGVTIDTPRTARNTDGIDPANSTNVTIRNCYIRTGDDNVAIKAGAGLPTSHMTIEHNHFYTGHGMSIGSETDGGASAIRVTDLSIDGADNGIRIKSNISRGGLVQDVVYSDVCIRDTKNPVFMDSNYLPLGAARDRIPWFRGIVLRDVWIGGSGKITLEGLDPAHPLGMTFDGVFLDDPAQIKIAAAHAELNLRQANFRPAGDDVRVNSMSGETAKNSCAGKFVSFPGPGLAR
jgi:polygalacturonase